MEKRLDNWMCRRGRETYEEGVTFGDSSELFFVLVKKDPDLAKLEAFEKSEKQVVAG